ncbi:hypothetical protein OH492_05125 [Vibrio chagasii]|nr:hypothetical protein [Vibrio chagasii]
MGTTDWSLCNRIANGRFKIDGKTYS